MTLIKDNELLKQQVKTEKIQEERQQVFQLDYQLKESYKHLEDKERSH